MSKKLSAILATALIACPVAASAAGMQPGLWEITTSMEMSGVGMQLPATTIKHCYKPSDVADAKNIVPGDPQDKQCRVSDVSESGNTVSWKMSCSGRQKMNGNGTITYGSNSYSGVTQMSVVDGSGMAMNMTQKYNGKRLGDCLK
ncbi:MAG TPA: DUF3617 family protein [Burkholderiales bacterium]|nr:DUF3617 family protein [Burkholderiales bacterium]